jgi:hypothetical protein
MVLIAHEPRAQFLPIHDVARREPTRALGHGLPPRHQLHQALDTRDDHAFQQRIAVGGAARMPPRLMPPFQVFERAQSCTVNLIVDRPLSHLGFPGRQSLRSSLREHLEIVRHQLGDIFRATDDDQRARRPQQQARRQERARCPHDSVERGRTSGLEFRHSLGEAGMRFETPRQVSERSRRSVNLA